jgi:hypothetical protein
MRYCTLLCRALLSVALLALGGMLIAGELKDARAFYVNFSGANHYEFFTVKSTTTTGFTNVDPQVEIGRANQVADGKESGTPLSASAFRTWEDMRCGVTANCWAIMPTGQTDQAVAFAAKERVSTSGAISFWFRGQGWDYTPTEDKNKQLPDRINFRTWDVQSPLRETFFELRSPKGKVTFGKLSPGVFALEGTDGQRITLPAPKNIDLVHLVTINYADGHATILIDGVQQAEGAFTMPGDVADIVIGQVGLGVEQWNRWIDDFAIWTRPLTIAETMILWRKEGMFQLPLDVTIPKLTNAPTIDGLMKPGEWDHAAVVTGMAAISFINGVYADYGNLGELSDLKDRIYLAYDDRNLYMGYHCPPPREIAETSALIAVMLKKAISAFDANVDSDDSFTFTLQYPKPGGDYYRAYVNGLNTHYDFTHKGWIADSHLPGSPGECRLSWDPQWSSASTLDMDGWHLEIAFPLDSFTIPAPKTGDVWHMNFMRNWHTVRKGMQSWAWGNRTSHDDGNERRSSPAGRIHFGAEGGIVARQRSIGEISQGKPHFITELANRDAQPRAVRCLLSTNSGEMNQEKMITVPANGTATCEFSGRLVDPSTASITLKVLDAKTAQPIFVAGYPVQRPLNADVYLRKYPTRGLVKYEIDFSNHARYAPGEITIFAKAFDASARVVWSKTYQGFADYNFVSEIPIKDLADGEYTVKYVFKVPGKVVETVTQQFSKKPLPAWYANGLGNDPEDAPYPWTNIAVKDNAVTVWGRTYDFGDALYPRTVSTQGKTLLRAPMGVTVETNEGTWTADLKVSDAKWTKVSNTRVEGERRVQCGKLTLVNYFWIEYDGMVWSSLKLIPNGEVTVKSLVFDMPFTPEFSDVINARDYSMRNTGKLNPEGYTGPADPIWLGNGVGGMQWTTETVGPFELHDPNTAMRVTAGPEGGTVRIVMMDQPTELRQSRMIPFGFIATPARPKTLRSFEGDRFRRSMLHIGYWQDPEPEWKPFHLHWVNKSAVQRGRMYGPDMPGVEARCVHHTTLMMMAAKDEAMQEFGDEWITDTSTRWRGKYAANQPNVTVTTTSPSLCDYIVWRFNEYFKQQPVPGGYFDVSDPQYSSNPDAGAGYQRSDGTRVPSLNLLGHRNVLKRIYNIQNDVFPGGGLWFHASTGPQMVFMSYCVGNYDGENGNSIINGDNPTYRTLLTPDHYRAQYMASNWGHWNSFLSQGRIKEDTLRKYGFDELWDQWTGLQWLHDCFTYTGWFGTVGYLEPLLTQRDLTPFNKYHLFSPCNRFIPYWEQAVTKLDRPEFYASFYVKEPIKPTGHYGMGKYAYYSNYETGLDGIHQAVLVLYNHGDYEGPVRLQIDWKQLGFDDWQQVKAINAVHATGFRVKDWDAPKKEAELYDKSAEEYARIEDGELVFPISEYNYRMIILQAPKPWDAGAPVQP